LKEHYLQYTVKEDLQNVSEKVKALQELIQQTEARVLSLKDRLERPEVGLMWSGTVCYLTKAYRAW